MAMHKVWKGFAEFFLPVPKSSTFTEKGTLTPEEFVAAGDLLVHYRYTHTTTHIHTLTLSLSHYHLYFFVSEVERERLRERETECM